MAIQVWIRKGGKVIDGEEVLDIVPKELSPNMPPGEGWNSGEVVEEYWWEYLKKTKYKRVYLKYLASKLNDGRKVEWKINALQIRLSLNNLGRRTAFENFIKNANQNLKDWWQYSSEFDRWDPFIQQIQTALGLTDTQMDNIWELAETL